MWTKKDTLNLTLAAAAMFAITVATFLPRIVNATNENATAVVLSPVLHVGECEVSAKVAGDPSVYKGGAKDGQAIPGRVEISAGAIPSVKFTVSNPTDSETSVTFTAALASSSTRDMFSRRPVTPTQRWNEPYNLTLKAHEVREIEVDTKVSLDAGTVGYLTLQTSPEKGSTLNALTFNVPQALVPTEPGATPPTAANQVKVVTPQAAKVVETPATNNPVKVNAETPVGLTRSAPNAQNPVRQ